MNPEQSTVFSGQISLVTGASSGIGRATACRLARDGAHLIAIGRNETRLQATVGELGARSEGHAIDVTQPAAISCLMAGIAERHGRLDILVVNAGTAHVPDIGDLDLTAYHRLMDVNVTGAVFTFVHALPLLAEGASVVFVGSVAARKGQPGNALYAGSKGFLRAFARAAGTSPDLMRRRIRVNVVSPGPIETPLTEPATGDAATRAWVEGLIPMRRWGQAQEVAEAIRFLVSPAASFTTGADITVDGGMSHV